MLLAAFVRAPSMPRPLGMVERQLSDEEIASVAKNVSCHSPMEFGMKCKLDMADLFRGVADKPGAISREFLIDLWMMLKTS